jgi:hypothetical protein
VDADVDHLGVEDVAEPVADDVVEGLDLELAGERLLDIVDDRQLGVALPGLLDRAGAGEGCADMLPDKVSSPLSRSVYRTSFVYDCTTRTPVVRPSALSGTPSQLDSAVSTPTTSISPSAASPVIRSWESSCGSPVRRTYAVVPRAFPVPNASHWLGSGISGST